MAQLPHGGTLILRNVSADILGGINSKSLPRITVNQDFILDLEKIGIGAYSPLCGFMNKEDFVSVIERMRLSTDEPWTIPIFLSLDSRIINKLSRNQYVIVCNEKEEEIGLMRIGDIFEFDKRKWAKKVFGTTNQIHPGVKRIFAFPDKLVGGDVWLIRRPYFSLQRFNLTPLQTRLLIEKKKWKTVCGFQTRNVPHRAHEYLQKVALSFVDGLLIHPIIGWKKDGDFIPETIIKAYKVLIEKYFPKNSVIFAGLATAMRYAGPKEAVFHAIIRKNYGCTHFIVGRDHAGVGGHYEKYEAHRIFDKFPDLGIVPLLLKGPYFCRKCNEVVSEKICPHSERSHSHISGTIVRRLLAEKKAIQSYLLRPEVVRVLKAHMKDARGKGYFL